MGRSLFSLYIYIENFNDLLVRNHWTDFNITLQECFFCNPLPRLFKSSLIIKKRGRQGAGLIFPIHCRSNKSRSVISPKSSILRIVRGPQIYHEQKKKKKGKKKTTYSMFVVLLNLRKKQKKKQKKLTVFCSGLNFSRICRRKVASRIMTKQSN